MSEIESLGAACDALGKIMLEMQRRRLLARPGCNETTRKFLSSNVIDDEALGKLAADAFEAAARRLVELKAPGATMHACTADDMEPR